MKNPALKLKAMGHAISCLNEAEIIKPSGNLWPPWILAAKMLLRVVFSGLYEKLNLIDNILNSLLY